MRLQLGEVAVKGLEILGEGLKCRSVLELHFIDLNFLQLRLGQLRDLGVDVMLRALPRKPAVQEEYQYVEQRFEVIAPVPTIALMTVH